MDQGQYGLTHIVLLKKKMINFCQSTYGWYYVVFSNISRNFRSRYHTTLTTLSFQELYIGFDQTLFFLLQIYLKNTNQEKYGLTHNFHFTKIWPILLKAHVVGIAVHFLKYLTKSEKNFNHGQYGSIQIVHLKKIDQFL